MLIGELMAPLFYALTGGNLEFRVTFRVTFSDFVGFARNRKECSKRK